MREPTGRWFSVALAGVLLVSAFLTALTAGLLPPGGGPDENAHYSYVQHVAREPMPFPPRYEEMFTGSTDNPNHLVHPPAYYYLAALPYRLLGVERQLTSLGLEADAHGAVTARAVIRPLRTISLALTLLHLLGLFLLLRYLADRRLVPPWAAIALATASSWVASTMFISATLNNDALIRAIWPWLAIAVLRFALDGCGDALWCATGLVALGVLTKGTFWPAAIVVTLTCLAVAHRRDWVDLPLPSRITQWRAASTLWTPWLMGAAVIVSATAVWHIVSVRVRYGSVQPSYAAIFGLAPSESKFYRASVADAGEPSTRQTIRAIWEAAQDMLASFVGVMGQHERILLPETRWLVVSLVLVGSTTLVVALVTIRPARRTRASLVGSVMVTVGAAFVVTYVARSWRTYGILGNFGAQGRYLIGYVDIWLMGAAVLGADLASRIAPSRTRRVVSVAFGALLVLLAGTLARPWHYFASSVEIHHQVGIQEMAAEYAATEGLEPLTFEATSVDARVITVGRSGRILPDGAWTLSPPGGSIVADIPHGEATGDCFAVLLHTRSSDPSTIIVIAEAQDGDPVVGGSTATVALTTGIELVESQLPPLVSVDDEGRQLMLSLDEQSSAADVLQVFAGVAQCTSTD